MTPGTSPLARARALLETSPPARTLTEHTAEASAWALAAVAAELETIGATLDQIRDALVAGQPDTRPAPGREYACLNCGRLPSEHCTVHLVPCCPGKCPGPPDPPGNTP